jgi:hypothetical protein
MKQNGSSKRIQYFKSRTRTGRMWLGMILATFLVPLIFSVPESFAKKAVLEKVEEQDKKEQTELKSAKVAPKTNQAAVQSEPVELQQDQIQPASAVTEKGKQLKWQVVSSGSDCGTSGVTYRLGAQDGCELCGTVGQLAVGPGNSPSYGVNSGYWQEDLQPYGRGDVNKDGIIDVADVMYLINYLFIGGSAPDPMWLGDATCDDAVDVADVMYLINYLFIGGSAPSC